jgi:hypothetical protein
MIVVLVAVLILSALTAAAFTVDWWAAKDRDRWDYTPPEPIKRGRWW